MLGGHFIIDVESDEEAIEWAARMPQAEMLTVEVRRIVTGYGGG